jgi:hypothetical protein
MTAWFNLTLTNKLAFFYIDRYCRYFVEKYGSRNLDTTSRMEGLVGIVEA